MRPSWILIVSALCTETYSQYTQQVLGSLELLGNSYHCENGVKPSLECTDESAQPNCSCNCSNGIMFNQTLSAISNPGSGPSLDACQASNDQCLQREQQCNHAKEQCSQDAQQCNMTNELQAQDLQQCNTAKELQAQDLQQCNEAKQSQAQNLQQLQNDRTAEQLACKNKEDSLQTQLDNIKKTNFVYQGCYTDDHNNRVLRDNYLPDHSGMTPQKCANFCKDYRYYGLEYEYECYCGNSFKGNPRLVNGAECNQKCKGDRGQICGASLRMSVYAKAA